MCNLTWRRREQRSVHWRRNRESLIRFVHLFIRCGVITCSHKRLVNLQKQRVEGWGTERAGVKFLLLAKDKLKSVVFRIRKRNQISKSHFAEC